MKKTNVLLVGIGGYGEIYVEDIFENPHPSINLIGAVEPYPERCKYYQEFKNRNIPIYSKMSDFFEIHSADLTVISTPIFLHTEHIIEALKNNSNVLCEKPLCADENDIELICAAQEKSGKFVYIGYQWSYSDAITTLKADVQNKKLGDLIEAKTLILRPRTRDYFERGVGWAGKIKTADGKLVYDSVANNSAAHYLFNMLYIMDDGNGIKPENVSAELLRANNIENFDTSKISFTVNGAKMCFIAAHPVKYGIEPIFEYKFTNGTVYYSSQKINDSYNLMPKQYTEYGKIVAVMNDGSKVIYGDPMDDQCKKLHIAAMDAVCDEYKEPICGVESASVHTKLINTVQKEFQIYNVKQSCLIEECNLLYADGLFEKALECYRNTDNSMIDFAG